MAVKVGKAGKACERESRCVGIPGIQLGARHPGVRCILAELSTNTGENKNAFFHFGRKGRGLKTSKHPIAC